SRLTSSRSSCVSIPPHSSPFTRTSLPRFSARVRTLRTAVAIEEAFCAGGAMSVPPRPFTPAMTETVLRLATTSLGAISPAAGAYPAGSRDMRFFRQSEKTPHAARGQCRAGMPVVDAGRGRIPPDGRAFARGSDAGEEHLFRHLLRT